jgi:hypothetical protein
MQTLEMTNLMGPTTFWGQLLVFVKKNALILVRLDRVWLRLFVGLGYRSGGSLFIFAPGKVSGLEQLLDQIIGG